MYSETLGGEDDCGNKGLPVSAKDVGAARRERKLTRREVPTILLRIMKTIGRIELHGF
jgi:hypothetical protein